MKEAFTSGLGFAMSPNIDGYVLEQGYNETIEKNLIKNIPYMLGCTEHDILGDPEEVKKGEKGELYEGGIRFSHMTEKLQQSSAYVYYFTRNLPGDMAGAFHSSELWYVFGTLDHCWRPFSSADHKLSVQIITFWTNFMKYADPNGQNDPNVWKVSGNQKNLRFSVPFLRR